MSNPFDPTYGLSGDMGLILAKAGWLLCKGINPLGNEVAYFCHPNTGQIRQANLRRGDEWAAISCIIDITEENK
jgi:hypothetical protein